LKIINSTNFGKACFEPYLLGSPLCGPLRH
jgi:hypothetical protein